VATLANVNVPGFAIVKIEGLSWCQWYLKRNMSEVMFLVSDTCVGCRFDEV